MKIKILLKSVIYIMATTTTMLYAQVPAAQDTIVIASGAANVGLLEATINGDKDASNVRIHPNRVYKLATGFHYVQSAINVNNPTGTIKIVGEKGGKKPVIIPVTVNSVGPNKNIIKSNLELKNLHIQGRNDEGGRWGDHLFNIQGDIRSLFVEDCLIEFAQRGFQLNQVTESITIEMRNNYFRDFFMMSQQWAGNVFNTKGRPLESLIFENNTVSNSNCPLLMQNQMIKYALINHNTFINTSTFVNLNPNFYEAYITNNLFYNTNTMGKDSQNDLSSPDGQATPIIAIDTLDINIGVAGIPSYAMNAEKTSLIAPYNDVSNYKIYAADNIYFNQPTLDVYNNGSYSAAFPGVAPESYLSWHSPGPHRVDVPALFTGAREDALFDGNDNIKRENNIFGQDPGLGTEAISVAEAEQLAIWQRLRYEVPTETGTPDMTSYFFGDFDPTTIPGVGSEDGDGILKFSDLIEDFSIGAFTSNIDGHTIGALHWTSEIDSYDPVDGLADIIAAYNNNSLSVDDIASNLFELKSYPNPSNNEAVIQFSMPAGANLKISVYNILGVHITTIVDNESYAAGKHSVKWNTSDVNSGLYFCKLEAGKTSQTLKMIVSH